MAQGPPNEDSESQALRRTTRSVVVPERARQELAERTEKRAAYERNLTAKKRKAFAEARDASAAAADEDSSEEPEQDSKRPRKGFNDALLMQPYDHLTNEFDRTEWLLAAICRRDGDDLRNAGLTCEDLEERWEESDGHEETQVNHYAGIKIDQVEHPVAEGRVSAPRGSTESRLCTLQPTDHTTIGPGGAITYRGTRSPDGRHAPIDGDKGKAVMDVARKRVGGQSDRDGGGSGVSTGEGRRVAASKPVNAASGSQASTNGYANEFRVTLVPQPKPRDTVRAHVPQSNLRLVNQLSQPASNSRFSTPRRPLNEPTAASPPNHARRTASAGPHPRQTASASPRARVPTGPRYVRASSTPNPSSRSPAISRRASSVPRQATLPPADEDVPEPPVPEGYEDDTDIEETGDGLRHGQYSGMDQSFFDDGADAPTQSLTRRQLARLSEFGPAKPLVQLLNRIVKLQAITECPYADVIPYLSEPDENGNRHEDGMLIDHWLIKGWEEVNRRLRPGLAPLPLLEQYCTHVKDDFSGIRNHPKAVLLGMVPREYGFDPGYSDDNKTKVADMLPDAFHSASLQQPSPDQFQHSILPDGIRACWFASKKAIGFKHAAKFRPMPLPVFAFVCTIIHFIISDFSSGEQKLSNLDAQDQAPFYEMYLESLQDMGKPGNNPQRLINLQRRVFDKVHGKYNPAARVKIQRPVMEYGADSEEEYTYDE